MVHSLRSGEHGFIPSSLRRVVRLKEKMDEQKNPEYVSAVDRRFAAKISLEHRSVQQLIHRRFPNIKGKITEFEASDIKDFFSKIKLTLVISGAFSEGLEWVERYTIEDAIDDYVHVRFDKKFDTKTPHPISGSQARDFVHKMIEFRLGVSFPEISRRFPEFVKWLDKAASERNVAELFGVDDVALFKRIRRAGGGRIIANQQAGLVRLMVAELRLGPKTELSSIMIRGARRLKRKPTSREMRLVRKRIPHLDSLKYPNSAIRDVRMELIGNEIGAKLREILEWHGDYHPIQSAITDEKASVDLAKWLLKNLKNPINRKFLAKKAVEWFG
jgi:hypothetical protein